MLLCVVPEGAGGVNRKGSGRLVWPGIRRRQQAATGQVIAPLDPPFAEPLLFCPFKRGGKGEIGRLKFVVKCRSEVKKRKFMSDSQGLVQYNFLTQTVHTSNRRRPRTRENKNAPGTVPGAGRPKREVQRSDRRCFLGGGLLYIFEFEKGLAGGCLSFTVVVYFRVPLASGAPLEKFVKGRRRVRAAKDVAVCVCVCGGGHQKVVWKRGVFRSIGRGRRSSIFLFPLCDSSQTGGQGEMQAGGWRCPPPRSPRSHRRVLLLHPGVTMTSPGPPGFYSAVCLSAAFSRSGSIHSSGSCDTSNVTLSPNLIWGGGRREKRAAWGRQGRAKAKGVSGGCKWRRSSDTQALHTRDTPLSKSRWRPRG